MARPMPMINVTRDILLLKERAIYIRSLSALVLSDMHIGIEYSAALKGVFLPTGQYSDMKASLDELVLKTDPKRIIVVGDLKHEFSKKTLQELSETINMLEFLSSLGVDFVLIRGNHDNFLRGFLSRFEVEFVEDCLILGDYAFSHGHIDILEAVGDRTLIMGHEHPSILFTDRVGGRAKVPALLHGRVGESEVLVLPAFSPLAPGSEVNALQPSDLLSPILKKANIDDFRAYPILRSGVLPPVKVRTLRALFEFP